MAGWAIAADVVGKAAGGVAEAQARREEIRQRQRELQQQQQNFNTNLGEQQRQYGGDYKQRAFDQGVNAQSQFGDRAQSVNRELELLPMRDRAAALMQQRMASPARQVAPRSLAGGTDSLRGGTQPAMPYDLEANRTSAQGYKAGDGGMTGDVQRQLLERYMNVPKPPEAPAVTGPDTGAIERQVIERANILRQSHLPVGMQEQMLNAYRNELTQKATQGAR